MNNTKSNLPPNQQSFKQKLLWGDGLNLYKQFFSTRYLKFENFELLDNELIKISVIERDFHQKGANLNNPDQKIEFIPGEISNYHQIEIAYLQIDITVLKADGTNFKIICDPATNELNRLVNNGFSYCFKEGRLGKTCISDLEHNKYVGNISTIMTVLPSRD